MLRVPMIVRQEATQLRFLDKGPGVTDDRSPNIDPLHLAVLMQADIMPDAVYVRWAIR